jgi:pimeloyl-ACP methyl ester carboxylesterase
MTFQTLCSWSSKLSGRLLELSLDEGRARDMTLHTLLRKLILPVYVAAFPLATCAAADPSVHHLVHLAGRGGPAIIFSSGLGDTLDSWRSVQAPIAAECGRTLAYNRAGYEGSDAATGPRDAETIVAELRAELQRRGIAPPYVLVGHSLGGLYMQYFARQFPEEVAGLVLVDSTHWDERLVADSGMQNAGQNGSIMLFMSFIARRELADSAHAGEQVHGSPRARVPTIVLSSTGARRGETPAARANAARLQNDIVTEFAARHVRVAGSGHYIQEDQPQAVIDSVREIAGCVTRSAQRADEVPHTQTHTHPRRAALPAG